MQTCLQNFAAGIPNRGTSVLLSRLRTDVCEQSRHGREQHMKLRGGSDHDYEEDGDYSGAEEAGGTEEGEDEADGEEEAITDEDIINNTLLQKLGVPKMDEESFLKAREAAMSGNATLLEELRRKAGEEESMTPDQRLFWRMQRYAHPWPPPWLPRLQDQANPVVFLDIAIRALDRRGTVEHEGRITIELFSHLVPKTAENFRCFCTGEVLDPKEYKPVGYKGTIFHRIVNGFLVQGGDFVRSDGTGSYSIYGGRQFADESLQGTHSPGTVAMANTGERHSNGCQFFIVTAQDASFLDGRHVVVGHVVEGMETVAKIEHVPTIGSDHRPLRKVVVEECGMLLGPLPPHILGL